MLIFFLMSRLPNQILVVVSLRIEARSANMQNQKYANVASYLRFTD